MTDFFLHDGAVDDWLSFKTHPSIFLYPQVTSPAQGAETMHAQKLS